MVPEPPDADLVATATDPQGRTVELHRSTMTKHIERRHSELAGREPEIKKAVETAEKRTMGNTPDTEVLWSRKAGGPARWLVVVVGYTKRVGFVKTAYGSTDAPRPEACL